MKILVHTGGVFQTNGYILSEDNGTCIVIDAPAEIADFLDQSSLRATHLLLTHQHLDHIEAVSYTHLTLPTILRV